MNSSQYHVSSTTYIFTFLRSLYHCSISEVWVERWHYRLSIDVWSIPHFYNLYRPLLGLRPRFTFLLIFTFYYFNYIYFLDTIILEIVCQWLSTSQNNWWAYIVSFEHGGTWSLLLGLPVQTCLHLAWDIFVNGRNSVQVEDWWQSVVDDVEA